MRRLVSNTVMLVLVVLFLVINFVFGKRFTREQLLACLDYESWRSAEEITEELDKKTGAGNLTSTCMRVFYHLRLLANQNKIKRREFERPDGRLTPRYQLHQPSLDRTKNPASNKSSKILHGIT